MDKSSIGCFVYKWGRIALIIAIIATIIFVFYNSCLSKEESSQQSNAVGEIIGVILPDDTDFKLFLLDNIRKIAHFTEYGLLGIEIAIYILIYERKRWKMFTPASALVPFFVGFIDETIQIFSERGPSISDVWIDIGGFVFFSSIAYLVGGLMLLVLDFVKRQKQSSK